MYASQTRDLNRVRLRQHADVTKGSRIGLGPAEKLITTNYKITKLLDKVFKLCSFYALLVLSHFLYSHVVEVFLNLQKLKYNIQFLVQHKYRKLQKDDTP